ncbi:MAG TPA: hypothetical protein VEW05_10875 [Candidatus Polarisedimenticolia bacterium]|nr:hypothetical protein [Candidatus Polarisedimenticolia bacterium]
MGYESALHLVGIKIRPSALSGLLRTLSGGKSRRPARLDFYFDLLVVDEDGFLRFKASKDGLDPYVADEEGTVPALLGKWYNAEQFARWLKRYSEEGGRVVLHSAEADGETWGWEFDGKGRMRALYLVPWGKWK